MNYVEFKNGVQSLPIILTKALYRTEKNRQVLLNQLCRWEKKGLIIKLRRGMYLLNENDRKITPSRNFIAGQIYSPSYVSLECALSFYGIIPERVVDVTSVTTKKTAHFKNKLGNFYYQHIKPQAFRGFRMAKEGELSFFIAEPEKAVVDLFYLKIRQIPSPTRELFAEYFRFQNTENLKRKRIVEFAGIFNNDRLMSLAKAFCNFLRQEAAK